MDLKTKIKNSPMTWFQVRAIAICFILNLVDGYDVVIMPLSSPQVSQAWALDNVTLGYLLSSSLFGMAIGAFGLTPFADFIGRRSTTMIALALASAGMLIGCFAPGVGWLFASRIIAGIGIGGMVANLGVIVSEYSNRKYAALATGIYTAGYPVGAAVGGALAGVLIVNFGWRESFVLGAVLTIGSLILAAVWMPESYEYLINKGGDKSLHSLNKILPRISQPQVERIEHDKEHEQLSVPELFAQVFGGGMWKQTILAWIGYALLTSSFYFANSWTTKIIASSANSENLGVTANVLYNAGGIVGSIIFGAIAIRVLPRRLLTITMVFAALTYFLFGLLISNVGLAMTIGVLAGLAAVAGVSGVYLIGPTIYPTKARGAGFGWLMGVGRLASIVAPILAGYFLEAGMPEARVYQLFAIPLLISALAFFLLGVVRKSQGLNPEPTITAAGDRT